MADRYFQCLICKELKVMTDFVMNDVAGELRNAADEIIRKGPVIKSELAKILCHDRPMRELTESQYQNMVTREEWVNNNT